MIMLTSTPKWQADKITRNSEEQAGGLDLDPQSHKCTRGRQYIYIYENIKPNRKITIKQAYI